jgi:hypothetical protein
MNSAGKSQLFLTTSGGIFNIEADVIRKGEKVGAIGLEPTTSRM